MFIEDSVAENAHAHIESQTALKSPTTCTYINVIVVIMIHRASHIIGIIYNI